MALIETFALINLGLLLLLALGLGASIEIQVFKERMEEPKAIFIGLACQFVVLPACMFAYNSAFPVSNEFFFALTIVSTSPGGSFSNMVCWLFKADLPLSLGMTMISSLMSLFMIPLNSFLYLQVFYQSSEGGATIDWAGLSATCAVIIGGTFLGLYIGHKYRGKWTKRLEILGITAGISTFATGVSRNSEGDTKFYEMPWEVFLIMFLATLTALLITLTLSLVTDVPKHAIPAVCAECVIQNTNIALAIISISIEGEEAVTRALGVPIGYSFFHVLFGLGIVIVFWRLGETDLAPTKNPFWECYLEVKAATSGTDITEGETPSAPRQETMSDL